MDEVLVLVGCDASIKLQNNRHLIKSKYVKHKRLNIMILHRIINSYNLQYSTQNNGTTCNFLCKLINFLNIIHIPRIMYIIHLIPNKCTYNTHTHTQLNSVMTSISDTLLHNTFSGTNKFPVRHISLPCLV